MLLVLVSNPPAVGFTGPNSWGGGGVGVLRFEVIVIAPLRFE